MKTIAAQAAQLIRKELKEKYPNIKFKVVSQNYAGGNSINIGYTDGPTEKEVRAITKDKYQYGHFDGMTDCYDVDNSIEGLPQVSYVFVHRNMSEKAIGFLRQKAQDYIDKMVAEGHNSFVVPKEYAVSDSYSLRNAFEMVAF